jgi:predicted transcriptional regulator
MASKSTVAIDPTLRKKIKKLAARFDISQGEIINIAIAELEKKLNKGEFSQQLEDIELKKVKEEMHEYTKRVWAKDEQVRIIQEKFISPAKIEDEEIDLDDIIIRNWRTGLEE